MRATTQILAVAAVLAGGIVPALLATGCSPDDPPATALAITQPAGQEALARYVALGDGMTAGFMDGGLIVAGQVASYPARIAGRLGLSPAPGGAGWFAQPLVAWPGLGSTPLPDPSLAAGVLRWDGAAISLAGTTPRAEVAATLLLAAAFPTPYHNLGIPGATILDARQALDSATSQQPGNAYFDAILRNPTFGDVVQLEQTIAQGPTLATVWLGTSDILGGALGGQPAVGVNITPPAIFGALLDDLVARLADGVRARYGYVPHLVVGNLPPLLSLPYFVPKPTFDAAVGTTYPTDEADVAYVLFPALVAVQGGYSDPLPATWTLTAAEAAAIDGAIDGYNEAIADLADAHGFTVADLHALIAGQDALALTHFVFLIGQGATVEEAAATTLVSLDGLHLNTRGQSLLANAFLTAINGALDLTGGQALAPVPIVPWDPTHPAPSAF
jgi:lysophospholipase L1-like esterase